VQCRSREREMRGPEQVRRRGGERDKYIMWIRMRGGDFFLLACYSKFRLHVVACSKKFVLVAVGYIS
jgi:hypothetical protein